MATVFDVADFYLSKAPMTQKKLQKLVYYAYSWTLALLNDDENNISNRLFNEPIQAWIHGPVCPPLYKKYQGVGWQTIPQGSCDKSIFTPDVPDVMEQVWDVYGEFNGNQLESICHQEDPWCEARKGYSITQPSEQVLDDKAIYQYYNKQMNEE